MTALARQHGQPDPEGFVSVEEAARITGESVRHWRRRAVQEFDRSGGELARRAAPESGTGKPVWFVHRSLDGRLSRCPQRSTRDERATQSLAARFPQHLIERGLRRNHWLKRWRKECATGTDREAAERIVLEARRVEPDFRVSVRSLFRWYREYTRLPDDGQIKGLAALVER